MPIERDRFRQVVQASVDDRRRVRQLVAEKRWSEAEPDKNRLQQYKARVAANVVPYSSVASGAESMQGDTFDLQPVWFLPEGAKVRRAVGYVEVTDKFKSDVGTGFLVSPHLFLTNRHVIPDESAARNSVVTFDREIDGLGRAQAVTVYRLDPDKFSLFSVQEELDYALVAVGDQMSGKAGLDELNYCILSDRPDKHAIGMNVNIIQHPRGWPKMIGVRNNLLEFRTERTLLYQTDTDQGSSGSPVFNDEWEVIALHHWGEPFLEMSDEAGKPIPTQVNEGVRISALYRDLEAKLTAMTTQRQALLRQALAYSKNAPAAGQRLTPPRPSRSESQTIPQFPVEDAMTSPSNIHEMRFTIPIEIVVRLGAPAAGTSPVATVAPVVPPTPSEAKTLKAGAEKLQIDQDYTTRSGYNPKFIPGMTIQLPVVNDKLSKQVAPLRASEANAEDGELKYEHFSIKLNQSKRMAIYSATNIDGNAYLAVDRVTGLVKDEAEGETWYRDPRVSASFYLDQSFYGAWSNYFDRGHLTRRTDPTWGSPEEAERANADTYHFTNCTPQHFRFNQSAKYWQGAERYILENGAVAEETKNRISVFQGPIFNDKIDLWSDDVQIPSAFFKVIAWKGKGGPKSVGLVVDQLPLMSEQRVRLGQPRALPAVDVSEWRMPVKTIEQRTGLDFGIAVRKADTIQSDGQPSVGEALVAVRSFADLLPR